MKSELLNPNQKIPPAAQSVSRAGTPGDSARQRSLKLTHILVPTDFSECSKKALQYAVAFARDYHATVAILHVIEGPAVSDDEQRRREVALQAWARQSVGDEVPVTVLVKTGGVLREIASLARTGRVDLLIISTHERAGFPDFCLGSAAEEIVRYAPCPVLVVRQQEHDFLPPGQPPPDPPRRQGKRRVRA